MFRFIFAASILIFPHISEAQELLLFDRESFGKTVLPNQNQSMLGGNSFLEANIGSYNNEFIANYSPSSFFALAGQAVGRLDILTDLGHAPCTAFLIDNNRILTNHHCIPGILDHPDMKSKGAKSILSAQLQLGYTVDGVEEGSKSFRVDIIPLETNEDLDYTVLQVIGDANTEFGALQLGDATIVDHTPLLIIGHPMGEAQRISREKCKAATPAIADNRLRHTCDTLPGNSGSPVLDADLKQVVALHHAGSRAGDVNFAVPMVDILEASTILKSPSSEVGPNPTPAAPTGDTNCVGFTESLVSKEIQGEVVQMGGLSKAALIDKRITICPVEGGLVIEGPENTVAYSCAQITNLDDGGVGHGWKEDDGSYSQIWLVAENSSDWTIEFGYYERDVNDPVFWVVTPWNNCSP